MKLRKFVSLLLALLLLAGIWGETALAAKAKYDKPYYIEVDLTNQIVTIYRTQDDSVIHQMLCSAGELDYTPRGTFYLPKTGKGEREEWYYFSTYSCYAQYATRIIDNVLFHSIPCNAMTEASISAKAVEQFGNPASHGCVRLRWQDAKFIAENCEQGTRVKIYKSRKPNEDLRQLLYRESYAGETGKTYDQFLGIPDEEGALGLMSKGSAVKDLQYRLRDLGIFGKEITGEYRGETVNAVRTAQALMGVEETGVASESFQAYIYSDEAPVAQDVKLAEGISGPAVRNLQQHLADLRLYDGAIDSVYDVDVVEAVKLFQSAYGYAVDGVATPAMQKALYYEAGRLHAIFDQLGGYTFDLSHESINFGKVVCPVGIRLRAKPNTHSNAMGHLADGDTVVLLEQGKEWSQVQRGKSIGYVNNTYVQYFTQDTYALKYATLDGNAAYTIGFTAKDYADGAILPSEAFAEYLASGGSMDSYADLTAVATVNTGDDAVTLNLRETPSTDGTVLAALPNGAQARAILPGDAWTLVDYEGTTGYLLNQYIAISSGAESAEEAVGGEVVTDDAVLHGVVRAKSGDKAAVYDVDSDDAEVLGHLKNGISVDIIETVGGWSLISYQDHQGYMRDEDLQFVNDVAA